MEGWETMGRRKPLALEIVQQRIFAVHGDIVKIVPETYRGVGKQAIFVDSDFGEWLAWPPNVFRGHGHPLRATEKTSKTCMGRYGGTTPLGSPAVRVKIEATNLERYGHKNPLGSPEVQAQRDATMLERYGAVNPQQVPEIRARMLATNVELYGAPYPLQSPEILARSEATNLERYGVKNSMQREEVKEKSRQTCLERYGVENSAQDPIIHARTTANSARVTPLIHWRTHELLQCKGSYEVAFVAWCNANQVDFDWQVAFKTPVLTPTGRQSVYFIDAYIKTGEFADTYVELKGTWNRKNGHVGKAKWEWFHETHPNSALWTGHELRLLGILNYRRKAA